MTGDSSGKMVLKNLTETQCRDGLKILQKHKRSAPMERTFY